MKRMILYITLLLLVFGSVASAELGDVDIHGFVSQGYLYSDEHQFWTAKTDEGTFEYNEVGINFGTDVTDNLRLGIQMLAKDFGSDGNDDVVIDWAFGDYRFNNYLGVRAGKIKIPYGFYNQTRDIDAARTSIFLPTSVYNEQRRETVVSAKGVGVYGTLPFGFEYEAQIGVLNIPPDGGTMNSIASIVGAIVETDVKTETNAQLIWNTPLDGLRFGASYLPYDFDAIRADSAVVTVEGYFYALSAEYMFDELNLNAEWVSGDSEMYISGVQVRDTTPEQYFVRASYRFTDLFELGAYYSQVYVDNDDKDTVTSQLQDIALSTRFDLNDYWILKLEVHAMDGLNYVTQTTDPNEDKWMLYATKVSYTF